MKVEFDAVIWPHLMIWFGPTWTARWDGDLPSCRRWSTRRERRFANWLRNIRCTGAWCADTG